MNKLEMYDWTCECEISLKYDVNKKVNKTHPTELFKIGNKVMDGVFIFNSALNKKFSAEFFL